MDAQPSDLPTDLIQTAEAAKVAKCHPVAITRWCKSGKLRGWRRAGRLFVSRAEVEAMFEPVQTTAAKHTANLAKKHSATLRRAAAEADLRKAGWMP